MSSIETPAPPQVAQVQAPAPARPRRWRYWAGVALTCLALGASGATRLWQEQQVEVLLEEGRKSPFPLEEMPMNLGPWKGQATKLDPQVAAGTGSVDNVFRRYVNQLTGAAVDVIVLYGPTTNMFIHSPEICYPAAGYQLGAGPDARMIPIGEGRSAPFRALVYTKGDSGVSIRQEVYFAWRYLGRWSPDVGSHKRFERIPGMYKVHVAREVGENELRGVGNPCESLLEYLVPELERRIAAARPSAAAPPTAAAPASS